jgi:hypothetical protein
MSKIFDSQTAVSQAGFSGIIILLFILIFLLGLFGADYGYVKFSEKQNIYPTVTPYPGQKQTPVSAHGSITKSKYTVNIELNFLLEGGSVTGSFSGACDGTISGYYDGKDGGALSGKAVGSCDPFFVPIPASGTFSGNVFPQQKTIPVTGSGSAGGFSGEGSLTFTF